MVPPGSARLPLERQREALEKGDPGKAGRWKSGTLEKGDAGVAVRTRKQEGVGDIWEMVPSSCTCMSHEPATAE